jgi:uncharacterized protein YcfL
MGKKLVVMGVLLLFLFVVGCIYPNTPITSNSQRTTTAIPTTSHPHSVGIIDYKIKLDASGGPEMTGVVQNYDDKQHQVSITVYCYDGNGMIIDQGVDSISVKPNGGTSKFITKCIHLENIKCAKMDGDIDYVY